MTNEEAIRELKDVLSNALEYKDSTTIQAFQMAIEALETQEDCEVEEC